MTDVRVSLGTIVATCHRVSDALKAPVEQIATAVRQSAVAYVDETGFKEAGQRRYVWAATTKAGTYYRIMANRSQAARRELLGDHQPGQKRVTDWFSGYHDIPVADRALCHAHLKRDLEGLKGRNQAATAFAERMQREQRRLFDLHRAGAVTESEAKRRSRMLKARFGRLLNAGTILPDANVQRFCGEFDRFWPSVFACLDHPEIDPTNNAAERALRPAVIWRKTSFVTTAAHAVRHGIAAPALVPVTP